MNRLICRLLGHKWMTVWSPPPGSATYATVSCQRCHETGWQA